MIEQLRVRSGKRLDGGLVVGLGWVTYGLVDVSDDTRADDQERRALERSQDTEDEKGRKVGRKGSAD
jgi:hypothetical protein